MYHSSYDEYIRSILGYPSMNQMGDYHYQMSANNEELNSGINMNFSTQDASELENCYPEIYKVVYPMVKKRCQTIATPVSKEMVENITDEIYLNIEGNNEVNIAINLRNEVNTTGNANKRLENRAEVGVTEKEGKRETRQINRGLRDIIKILILRELLGGGRPPFRPRPPFPGPGGRPPFPGGPGPVRPPMRPRAFEDNLDIYEY